MCNRTFKLKMIGQEKRKHKKRLNKFIIGNKLSLYKIGRSTHNTKEKPKRESLRGGSSSPAGGTTKALLFKFYSCHSLLCLWYFPSSM